MFLRAKKHLTNLWHRHVHLTPKKDHFFILNFYLALAGTYLSAQNRLLRVLWKIYRVFVILHYSMILRRLMLTLATERTFTPLLNGIHVALGVTIILTRLLLIEVNFRHFSAVRKYINERSFRPDDPDVHRVREQAYSHSVGVTLFFIANTMFQSVQIASSGMTDLAPFQIPFAMEDFTRFEQKLFRGLYSLLWTFYGQMAASNFLTIYLGLIGLWAEMRIAVESFEKVGERARSRLERRGDASDEEAFVRLLQEELNVCVEHHSVVLEQLKVFKNVTTMSFLLIYYMTMLFIALGVVVVIFSSEVDGFVVTAVDYTLRYTIECYVFCHMVSSINEVHFEIARKLPQQSWIGELRFRNGRVASQIRQIRTTLLIVMMQSQRGLDISCGGLFELTMGKFTSLINKSYSIMAFVWKAKNM